MLFETFSSQEFKWLPDLQIGYYQTTNMDYNDVEETLFAVDFVNKYTKLDILDIHCGDMYFSTHRENTYSYDLSGLHTDELVQRKLFRHPFKGANSVAFFDTLQKIQDPRLHLSGAKEYIFISCPVFNTLDEIFVYFNEHKNKYFWYWTQTGLLNFMSAFGFELIESKIDKDNIGLFAFKQQTE